MVWACPVGVRFRACAPCTQPFLVAPTPSETPSAVTSVARSAGLRDALLRVAQSPWPSLFVVARVAARRFRVRCLTAERAVRVGGVVTLTSLALISEVGRSPEDGAREPSVRQAFADVAGAVGRAGAPVTHTSPSGVDRESRPKSSPVVTTGPAPSRRQRRRRGGRALLDFPVRGPVSSPFGARVHPVTGRLRPHQGVDLAVPVGTPVVATAQGRVLSVGHRGGYGLAVEVGHRSSRVGSASTLYAHLSSLPAGLRVGLRVRRGTVIGYSGGVGAGAGISTGPHVHYEVRSGGVAVDPGSVALAVWVGGSVQSRVLARRVRRGGRSRADARGQRRLVQRGVP